MSTRVDIANRALQKVGARRIGSLDEGSREADSVKACFDILLQAELQTNFWTFATKRATLAPDSGGEDTDGRLTYSLPPDFLRLAPRDPNLSFTQVDYLFEGRKLRTNEQPPFEIRYVSWDIDTAIVDPLFAEALAARIAIEIVEELTQSTSKKDSLEAAYQFHVRKARQINAIQHGPIQPELDEWVEVRFLHGNGTFRNIGPIA